MARHTKITIDDDLAVRIENLLTGNKTIARFVSEATEEKVNRMEARDVRARVQMAAKDREILRPLVKELLLEMQGVTYG